MATKKSSSKNAAKSSGRKTMGGSKSTGSAKNKTSGSKTTRGTARKTSKRTLIEPHKGDKRYVRRDKLGEFKSEVNVGRSLAADRRRKSKTKVGKGQGDRGDSSSGGIIGAVKRVLKKI